MTEQKSEANDQDNLSPDEYFQLLQHVDLSNIYLVECAAKIKANLSDDEISLKPEFETHFDRTQDRQAYMVVKHTLVGHQNRRSVFNLKAEYRVVLRMSQEVPDEFFRTYSRYNLVMQTLPFFREWVATTSARMPIQPIIMPLLKPSQP